MLVMSRSVDERIILSDEVEVTVVRIEEEFVEISFSWLDAKRANDPERYFEEIPPKSFTLRRDESQELKFRNVDDSQNGAIVCIDIRLLETQKVRLGFITPSDCSIHRREVWEAIQKENSLKAKPD